jgi:hypothetical protein
VLLRELRGRHAAERERTGVDAGGDGKKLEHVASIDGAMNELLI